MPMGKAEITIDRSADEVWGRIGNFADASWVPGMERFETDGDIRTTWIGGREIKQRLLAHDDETRSYTYVLASEVRLPDGELAKAVEATISVDPEGPTSSRVTWAYETDGDSVSETHRVFYGGLLAQVKDTIESA